MQTNGEINQSNLVVYGLKKFIVTQLVKKVCFFEPESASSRLQGLALHCSWLYPIIIPMAKIHLNINLHIRPSLQCDLSSWGFQTLC
jgi:hypothetical protein